MHECKTQGRTGAQDHHQPSGGIEFQEKEGGLPNQPSQDGGYFPLYVTCYATCCPTLHAVDQAQNRRCPNTDQECAKRTEDEAHRG
jgi:hypothetical protein